MSLNGININHPSPANILCPENFLYCIYSRASDKIFDGSKKYEP